MAPACTLWRHAAPWPATAVAELQARNEAQAARDPQFAALRALFRHLPPDEGETLDTHGGVHWPPLWRRAILAHRTLTPAQCRALVALPVHPSRIR